MLSGGKLKLAQAIAHINRHSRDNSHDIDELRPLSNILDFSKSIENPSTLSTVASKLSKDEVSSIHQLGAFELLHMQFTSAKNRRVAWALASVVTFAKQMISFDSERTKLIDQINELRYEKHSLLEDNSTLRMHNENLIENLEKTNMEFQALSLNLDNMRLVRMVRVMSKMIEVPMAESFFSIYDNCYAS